MATVMLRAGILLGLAAWLGGTGGAQAPTDYQVKAAYLSNLGRFVDWPSSAPVVEGQPFNVCVLGEDPFGASLDAALAGENIGRAPLAAKRIASPRAAAGCRIVFVSSSVEGQLKTALAALEPSGALTVSDIPQFARRGGMIELVLVLNKVRFEINLAPVERAHLSLSSDLLKLAVAVRRAPR